METKRHWGKGHPKFNKISLENRQLIDNFCKEKVELYDATEETAGNMRNSLNRLANFIGNKSLKDVTTEDTKDFFKAQNCEMTSYTKRAVGNHIIQFY